jgi:hypothetical protein
MSVRVPNVATGQHSKGIWQLHFEDKDWELQSQGLYTVELYFVKFEGKLKDKFLGELLGRKDMHKRN